MNYYVIQKGDTLSAIAKIFNVTVQQLINANPGINPNALYVGQVICIPVAPSSVRIIVSIAAKTLSLYRDGRLVKSYPVATGKPTTPLRGNIYNNKQTSQSRRTVWHKMDGIVTAPLRHSRNQQSASIGTAASNGCIRMYNEDVNELFNLVSVGTPVTIY